MSNGVEGVRYKFSACAYIPSNQTFQIVIVSLVWELCFYGTQRSEKICLPGGLLPVHDTVFVATSTYIFFTLNSILSTLYSLLSTLKAPTS